MHALNTAIGIAWIAFWPYWLASALGVKENNVVFVSGIALALAGGSFYYSASLEEKNLAAAFPGACPGCRTHTKMLIPFLL